MFLKIATIIAIVGVALAALLSLIQQGIWVAGMYGEGIVLLSRVMTVLYLVLFNGSLLIFLVAFLLSLRTKTS